MNSVTDTADEINLIKQQNAEVGGRKRTVSKSKSITSNSSSRQTVVWPEFKVQVPDPELGKNFLSEIVKVFFNSYSFFRIYRRNILWEGGSDT